MLSRRFSGLLVERREADITVLFALYISGVAMSKPRGAQRCRVSTLTLPEILVKRLESLDVDIEAVATELLLQWLGLDPSEETGVRGWGSPKGTLRRVRGF